MSNENKAPETDAEPEPQSQREPTSGGRYHLLRDDEDARAAERRLDRAYRQGMRQSRPHD